jgi:hypothetical protein
MELALKRWFLEQHDKVNLNEDMLCAKAARFLQELHPDAPEMAFSQGWLEKFKDRHGFKSFRRFGESGALDMEAVGAALPNIRAVVDAYAKKDVFNMDEIGLCWRFQVDNSLAPISWKAGRSTRSASLLSFAQTRTTTIRFR